LDTLDKTREQLVGELRAAQEKIFELSNKQRHAEETLRQLQENTTRYLDLAEIILLALDECGVITMISGKCFDILGYTPDELVGKNWFKTCLPPEDYENVYLVYRKLINGELDYAEYYENDVLSKHGKHVHIGWHNSPLTDKAGKIIGTISAGTDITELRRAEKVLRKNEAQFRSIIDVSPVPYALNNQAQQITYLNPAFIATFGYDRKDIPTLDEWWPRAYPDPEYLKWVKATWQERINHALNSGKPFEPLEVNIRCKDGTTRTVLASAATLSEYFDGDHLVILYDITERKRAESALRESERKYRLLFENMTSGFALHEIICDEDARPVDYRYLELNPAFEKLTGVPGVALLGKTLREVMPDTEDYWIQTFGKVALTGESIAYENFSRELGKYYDTWVFSPQKNQFAVIFSDVTQRKQAEEKLREGDKYFQVLFAQSSFGVAKVDSDTGRFVKINQRFCELLGYSVDEMLQLDFKQVTYPEDLQGDLDNMSLLVAGKIDQIKREKRYLRKDGSTIWVNLSVLPLWDRQRTPDFHLTIVEDITERKIAEKKLQRQKDEQQHIINTMLDAVITIDETGTIQTFSKSAERMFDYGSREVIGQNIKLLMPSEYANRHDNYLAHYLETNEARIIGSARDVYGKRKNGELFPMRLSVAELPDSVDGARRFIGSCQDVTILKQQEEQLRRTQKMDALGKLTGGIAHDYNNMLSVIMGYAQELQDELANNPKLSKLANDIRNASERGTNLSRKLLAFTRKKEPQASVTDINNFLLTEQELLQKTLTPRIKINYELDEKLWPVFLDPGDLEDAILNLTINAMHAMESGGELVISTGNVCVAEQDIVNPEMEAGDYVKVVVSDTGVGMDEETRNKIFDPFFTTKGSQGVGLGLSMVYGFMKRSGGEILVTSAPGKGSEFVLYFPRYRGPIPTQKSVEDKNVNVLGEGESILVVDDEPEILALIEKILTKAGYTVFTADSGEQALRVLEKEKIQLIISDVIMPAMDGFQLVSIIREKYPELKIQLISGFTDERDDIIESSGLMKSLIYKPFPSEVLLRRVRDILDDSNFSAGNQKPVIMVMDDDPDLRKLFKINLEKIGYEVILVNNGEQALASYRQSLDSNKPIAAVIVDITIHGGMDGLQAAKELKALDTGVRLIVSSGDSASSVMGNFRDYGFDAAVEKTFDRKKLKEMLSKVIML